MNYAVHEAVEKEEAGDTKKAILRYLRTPEDVAVAERAMRESHRLFADYAEGLGRRYP
jgi:hypothetical protein